MQKKEKWEEPRFAFCIYWHFTCAKKCKLWLLCMVQETAPLTGLEGWSTALPLDMAQAACTGTFCPWMSCITCSTEEIIGFMIKGLFRASFKHKAYINFQCLFFNFLPELATTYTVIYWILAWCFVWKKNRSNIRQKAPEVFPKLPIKK